MGLGKYHVGNHQLDYFLFTIIIQKSDIYDYKYIESNCIGYPESKLQRDIHIQQIIFSNQYLLLIDVNTLY